MQQPPGRARDERLELPGPTRALDHLPLPHRTSPPADGRTTASYDHEDPVSEDPVSYEARHGRPVKRWGGTRVCACLRGLRLRPRDPLDRHPGGEGGVEAREERAERLALLGRPVVCQLGHQLTP